MSYQCTNPDCPNHTAQLPEEAAEKFDHKCFLCGTGELFEPALTLEFLLEQVDILPVALQILPRLQEFLGKGPSLGRGLGSGRDGEGSPGGTLRVASDRGGRPLPFPG